MGGTKGWTYTRWFLLGNTADSERAVAVMAAACRPKVSMATAE
jgi:hypothetical protein